MNRPFCIALGACLAVLWGALPAGGQDAVDDEAVRQAVQAEPSAEEASTESLPDKALLGLDDLPEVTVPPSRSYDRPLPEPASRALAKGQAALENDDVPAAVEHFKKALDYDPENPDLARLLGLAYFRLPNYGQSAKYLQQAAEYYSDSLVMQQTLAKLALLRKQPAEALKHFRIALASGSADPADPRTASVLLSLAELLQREGYWTASLEALGQLRDWLREHGEAYQADKQLRALLLNPERLLAVEGQLLLALRRTNEAIDHLNRAYRRNRSDQRTAQLLFAAVLQAERFDRAEQLLLDLAGQDKHASYVPRLAEKLLSRAQDPSLPKRLWKSYRAKRPVWPALAMALARSAGELGNLDDAHAILRSLLREVPDHAEAIGLQAELYVRQNQHEQALASLAALVARNPDSLQAVQAGVRAVLEADNDPELLQTLSSTANQADGEDAPARHYIAGLLAMLSDKPHLAADHFDKALAAAPDFRPAWQGKVELHLRNNEPEKLKVLMEQVRTKTNEGHFYHYILGVIRLAEDKPALATDALETARNQEPNHLPTLLKLAEAYRLRIAQAEGPSVRNVYVRRAVDVLEKVIDLAPNTTEAYRQLYKLYTNLNRHAEARKVAARLLKQQPALPDGPLLLVRSLLQAERIKQARQLAADLARRFPNRPDVALLEVRCDLADQDGVLPRDVYETLVGKLNKLLSRFPDDLPIQQTLAELLSRPTPGQYADAAVLWSRLYEQTPSLRTGKALVMTLRLAGQNAYAAKILQDLLQQQPDSNELRSLLADTFVAMDRPDRALELVKGWLKDDPGDAELLVLHLGLLQKTKRYDDAIRLLDDLAANPDSGFDPQVLLAPKIDLLCKAGQLENVRSLVRDKKFAGPVLLTAVSGLLSADRPDPAVDLLEEALQKKPNAAMRIRLRQSLLSVLIQAERYDEAIKRVETWLGQLGKEDTAKQERSMLQSTAVNALVAAGRFDDAAQRLDKLLAEDPNNAELYNLQATVLGELNRDDQALQALRRAIKLEPNDAGLQNNLAYFLADAGRELQRAEQLVTQAIRRSLAQRYSPPVSTQDTMGWVYYKQGRLGRAGAVFESILPETFDDPDELKGIHPVIWDHAGDVMYRLGWSDRAVEYWQQAVRQAETEKPVTREIRMVLKDTPGKIQAVREGREPAVAPLGRLASSPQKTAVDPAGQD